MTSTDTLTTPSVSWYLWSFPRKRKKHSTASIKGLFSKKYCKSSNRLWYENSCVIMLKVFWSSTRLKAYLLSILLSREQTRVQRWKVFIVFEERSGWWGLSCYEVLLPLMMLSRGTISYYERSPILGNCCGGLDCRKSCKDCELHLQAVKKYLYNNLVPYQK